MTGAMRSLVVDPPTGMRPGQEILGAVDPLNLPAVGIEFITLTRSKDPCLKRSTNPDDLESALSKLRGYVDDRLKNILSQRAKCTKCTPSMSASFTGTLENWYLGCFIKVIPPYPRSTGFFLSFYNQKDTPIPFKKRYKRDY